MLFDQFLAIDYGTKFIKGVLFKNVLGTMSIMRCETLEIIKLSDEEMDEYEYNIIRFIQSFFPEELKFISNICLDRIYIRDLVIPLTNEKAVREIIPFEVENKLPFPTESMEVLGVLSRVDEENSFVVTFNIEQNELARVMNPFTKGEARIACLSVDAYVLTSLLSTYLESNPQSEYIAQLDIGAEISLFNSSHKDRMYHTRSFNYGSEDLTAIIQDELKISNEDAEELKIKLSGYLLEEMDVFPEELEYYQRQYKISTSQWKSLQKHTHKYAENIAIEIEKSIFSLLDSERPQVLLISGGGSKLMGLDHYLSKRLEIPIGNYMLPSELNGDSSFVQAYSSGMHYAGKSNQKIDFLTTDFARKLNKNVFRLGNFLPHMVLSGISLFILLFVFIFGIIIDKRKISQNQAILVEKYKNGFGEEPLSPDTVMTDAISKLKKEQSKTEIFRLFLNKESILDILSEITEKYPDKDSFPFILDKFIFNGDRDEVIIDGRINDFADIGTVESALANSGKFKNVKVTNKRLITGVNRFKVSFKLRMDIVNPDSE
ncbi:MAG: pilus assembly protein PilM [Leptospira sp.]|nr:pilus assembly protein PilM [Leptospira sp.]